MTNTVMLRDKIESLGMSISFVAQKLGISREGLYKKLNNETEFKASEIVNLKELLRLSDTERDNIFFENKGEFKSRNLSK